MANRSFLPAGWGTGLRQSADLLSAYGKGLDAVDKTTAGMLDTVKQGFLDVSKAQTDRDALRISQATDEDTLQQVLGNRSFLADPGALAKLAGAQRTANITNRDKQLDLYLKEKPIDDLLTEEAELGLIDQTQPLLPQYSQIHQYNKENLIDDKNIRNLIKEEMYNQPFTFNPESLASSIDVNDPETFTNEAYQITRTNMVQNLKTKNPNVFDTNAEYEALADHILGKSKYASEFSRGKAFDAAKTVETMAVEDVSNDLFAATQLDPNDPQTYAKKIASVNNALQHIRTTKNIPKEDLARFDTQIMSVLEGINIVPGSGAQGRFGESQLIFQSLFKDKKQLDKVLANKQGIGLAVQQRFKDKIRKQLKDPKTGFPNLPDRIINTYIDQLINADSILGPKFADGKFFAEQKATLKRETLQSNKEIRLRENRKLIEINNAGGNDPTIAINDAIAALTKEGVFDNSEESLEDQSKFRDQVERGYTKARHAFMMTNSETGQRIDLLDDQGKDAFNMAFYKMINERVRMQKDSGVFGIRAWFTADYDVEGRGGELSDRDPRDLLRNLLKSVPSKASDRMKKNIKALNEAIANKTRLEKAGTHKSDNTLQQEALEAFTPAAAGGGAQPYNPWQDISQWPRMFPKF